MAGRLLEHQASFIDFLVRSEALLFGEFTLKSGRKSPYFINSGKFNTGSLIAELGSFYAAHIAGAILPLSSRPINIIFGPAYKGVPLAVATAMSLYRDHGISAGFTFDRKEEKDHGDKGKFVGHKINPGDNVLVVEDVITAGTTLRQVIPMLKEEGADLAGVLIAVDRCERGPSGTSAVQEARDNLGVEIFPLVTVRHIIDYLSATNNSGLTLSEKQILSMTGYLKEHGITEQAG